MDLECRASHEEEDRKNSANTHFEKWWFKTLLLKVTAIVALPFKMNKPVFFEKAGFFVLEISLLSCIPQSSCMGYPWRYVSLKYFLNFIVFFKIFLTQDGYTL